MAMSMFKLSITSRWALIAARGLTRLIFDRRRDLIDDRPNCATAAEAPLDEAQEPYHFDNPTAHTRGAYQHSEAIYRTCFAMYFYSYDLAPSLRENTQQIWSVVPSVWGGYYTTS
jgi:hypothetical protein